MKTTINNTLETMNAPQMLSNNEMNNVAGGKQTRTLFFDGFWEKFLRRR